VKTAVAIAALLTLAGCAYVGDPLPPALNLPTRIQDLRATQVGAQLRVEFTVPNKTTDGLVLERVAGVDLRIGELATPFNADQWAESAKEIRTLESEPAAVKMGIPVADWVGRRVVIGVRAINRKGMNSGWSNFVIVNVVPPLARVENVRAEATAQGVQLTWQSPADRFQVWRKLPGAPDFAVAAETGDRAWLDAAAEFDKDYEYRVVAVKGDARSEDSAVAAIRPVDQFPPNPPQGLRILAGVSSVELSWDPNSESDLRGYRLYRSTDDGAEERIAEMLDAPAYRDTAVATGKKYRYRLTAVDLSGNESRGLVSETVNLP
jgi:hypothetical protein